MRIRAMESSVSYVTSLLFQYSVCGVGMMMMIQGKFSLSVKSSAAMNVTHKVVVP